MPRRILANQKNVRTIAGMWGNLLGWCISTLWVALVLGGIVALRQNLENTTGRTEFSQSSVNAASLELDVSTAVVLPEMKDPSDAGPIYRRAIEAYRKQPQVYDQFARSGLERDVYDIPAIQTLSEAIPFASADLFWSDPPRVVNYDSDKPALDALRTLGSCARRAGQLIEPKQPDDALRLYEAAFALGDKLYRERLSYAEFDAGMTLLAEGSQMIRRASEARGDVKRVEACKQFDQARIAFMNSRVLPTQRILSSADDTIISQHAGDVFYIAQHSEERMWRVEAILKLGRYQYHASRVGDQRAAAQTARRLADDADPVIGAAAVAARDLTIQQYRMLK